MNGRQSRGLRRELLAAGAEPAEIDGLAGVAGRLKEFASVRTARARRPLALRFVPFGLTAAAGLALGAWLVIASQTVLPGSPLFSVQRFSDNAAVRLHPAYRGTVMMKRAQQIKQLVAAHAASGQVLAALADYRSVAAAYTFSSANYDVLEFCQSNLAEAARQAPLPEQRVITAALHALQNA